MGFAFWYCCLRYKPNEWFVRNTAILALSGWNCRLQASRFPTIFVPTMIVPTDCITPHCNFLLLCNKWLFQSFLSWAGLCLPDIVMFLDVDFVEHHIFLLGIDICLHLHGNMPWQHWKQQALLERVSEGTSASMCLRLWDQMGESRRVFNCFCELLAKDCICLCQKQRENCDIWRFWLLRIASDLYTSVCSVGVPEKQHNKPIQEKMAIVKGNICFRPFSVKWSWLYEVLFLLKCQFLLN